MSGGERQRGKTAKEKEQEEQVMDDCSYTKPHT